MLLVSLLLLAGGAPCGLAQFGFSQSKAAGALSGKLTDLRSAPLNGVTVTLRDGITGKEIQTTTAKGGGYRFSGLPAGEYSLSPDGSNDVFCFEVF